MRAARWICASMRISLSCRYSAATSPLARRRSTLATAMRMTFSGWFISCAMPVAISPRVAIFAPW
ncbi:hypothetical protein D3C81_1897300 [compost metagenome]